MVRKESDKLSCFKSYLNFTNYNQFFLVLTTPPVAASVDTQSKIQEFLLFSLNLKFLQLECNFKCPSSENFSPVSNSNICFQTCFQISLLILIYFCLTLFKPLTSFYTPGKHQKNFCFSDAFRS